MCLCSLRVGERVCHLEEQRCKSVENGTMPATQHPEQQQTGGSDSGGPQQPRQTDTRHDHMPHTEVISEAHRQQPVSQRGIA